MKVSLKIKTFENNKELLEKPVKALKKVDDRCITYVYIDEFGKNIIKIFENFVIIEREGQVRSSLLLKKGYQTELDYESKYLKMKLVLFTRKLNINDKGFEGEYILYQEKEIINEIFISIEEVF